MSDTLNGKLGRSGASHDPQHLRLKETGRSHCRNIPISNNVGDVKHDVRTLPALVEERHFALVVIALSNLGLASNRSGQDSVRPSHLFDPNCDHDYLFEFPWFGERDAQSLRR